MTKLAENSRGALFMMGSMAAFTLNDACMKGLSGELPLAQAIFMRGVPTVVMMLVLAWALGQLRFDFPARDRKLIAIRNLTEIGAAYFFLTAIFNMPIANATAILQVLPLSITLGGALFLGEQVGLRRWTAILVGFFGVLLIVRPGFDGFTIYSLYVLITVCLVTMRDLLSRKISAQVPTLFVALSNAVSVTVAFGLVTLFTEWQPVSGGALLNLGAASVLIIGAYFCAVSAMRVGQVAVIAPFRFTALLWALLLGVVAFGERPDAITLLGAGIVVAMGVYTFSRERALAGQPSA
ncbi:putative membrane protein [Candidatus Rhodobacter oscarellae]|uniref:Putative membrane protein n=1 Tax=Candidatus Rhodobacter oscarellae TaxID=1675527 RepID=A0A0J9GRR7_9RHOB|nr:DMT family transporter [Candidatus Rhodobacter lobularis]KMW56168.1 putative membrane protein [Candidatus Rhodobacter lobularis]